MVRQAVLLNLTHAPAHGQPRLAGVPLLLRGLLIAQKAGLEEVLILGGADPSRLLADKRVKLRWRWLAAEPPGDERAALAAARGQVSEDFILLFADSVCGDRALAALRQAALGGRLARVAVHPGESALPAAASAYLCSPAFLAALAEVPRELRRVDELAAWLAERGRLDTVEIEGRLWGRTAESARLAAIERELSHFNLKPSDGIFAKFNKLVVAEPLIRLAVKTPATPNFVTGLGLVFALGAGWAFAQGSYWWSLAGAGLFYVSAIMDHVDGMVARLKFLESEFGVWFESAADYLSYLSVFVGLALGLYRETGFAHHLLVGGLFLFAWVMSFILMSRQRRRVSGDNPTDYPNRVHVALEKHEQNFFHWLARKFYFLVRRAVLPYIILVFCLLDLRVLLLGWVTFGANVVWLLTLYNNRLFRGAKPAAPAPAD